MQTLRLQNLIHYQNTYINFVFFLVCNIVSVPYAQYEMQAGEQFAGRDNVAAQILIFAVTQCQSLQLPDLMQNLLNTYREKLVGHQVPENKCQTTISLYLGVLD